MEEAAKRIAKNVIAQLIDNDECYVVEYRHTRGTYKEWFEIRAGKEMFGQYHSARIDIAPMVDRFTTTEDEFRIEKEVIERFKFMLSKETIRNKMLAELKEEK